MRRHTGDGGTEQTNGARGRSARCTDKRAVRGCPHGLAAPERRWSKRPVDEQCQCWTSVTALDCSIPVVCATNLRSGAMLQDTPSMSGRAAERWANRKGAPTRAPCHSRQAAPLSICAARFARPTSPTSDGLLPPASRRLDRTALSPLPRPHCGSDSFPYCAR